MDRAADAVKRGPWTAEEDERLAAYVAAHGEGRWNALAQAAGLRRTGKSCRLRWLNYLRPDVRRGNISPREQLLILELHSRWGNRWSKIAQLLPGRTDNEIKNYWRTRVQKHAKQLNCDVNSKKFKDLIANLWVPRLLERIRSSATDLAGGAVDAGSFSGDADDLAVSDYSIDLIDVCPPPDHQRFGTLPAAAVDDWADSVGSCSSGGGGAAAEFDLVQWAESLWNSDDAALLQEL